MVKLQCLVLLGVIVAENRRPKVLCVEAEPAVRESRCEVLNKAGYDTAMAAPHVAEIVLRSQKFDLVIFSTMSDQDQHRIIGLTDGAEVLVLDGLITPSRLMFLVAERLNRRQQRA